jgi:predicted kinase
MSPAPQLLLITGAPATGKTRLAARLELHYGACRCSKDEIKEVLFEQLGERDPQWSRQLSTASFALLFAYAPRLLSPQRLLLLEGNFRAGEHEPALRALMPASGAGLAQILCRAEAATCASRLVARAHDPGRHPGHRDREQDPAAVQGAAFLDLAGPRWLFHSDTQTEAAWLQLCRCIDDWRAGTTP